LNNGQVLQVISTWTDAKVFRTPHTYELRYTRLPRGYESRPSAVCDPYNDERAQFVRGTTEEHAVIDGERTKMRHSFLIRDRRRLRRHCGRSPSRAAAERA
jgi:hypothetical protein